MSGVTQMLALAVAGLVSSLTVGIAGAQQAAPTENKGFTASVVQKVELGREIEGMNGRELRMRTLTIQPGGYIGLHSHKDRPAVVYALKGTDTVIAADGTTKMLTPGESSTADRNTTHWHRNDGSEPVVLLAIDVFHSGK